ncbi:MAG: TonB-dependent receptor [Myxococcota bacterium]
MGASKPGIAQQSTLAQSETGTTSRPADSRGVDLESIVITGVGGRPKSQFKNSVSVSDLSLSEIKDFAPRTTAEIFRNIPGIRSESSGGENNANIQVRGLPVTTGGAKFVQLQEDGLPVLAFGDITFGNADNFLRFDTTVRRLEAIRGGSASTFASNAPGAIINFISRTGDVASGEIGLTRGIDFNTTRLDFEYGSPIFDEWQFHIGGFYRTGEGPRAAGYNAENGGQIKANLTRNFSNGYVRVYYKHLNDRTIPYLPAPVLIEDGEAKPLPQFDFRNQTLASRYLLNNVRVDSNGQINTTNIADGVRSLTNAVGLELDFDLGARWKLTNRGRYSVNRGGFVGSFANAVVDVGAAASNFGAAGLIFHNGPSASSAITGPSSLNGGSNFIIDNLLFDVNVQDLSHFVNDMRLARTFETGFGDFDVQVGYFKSVQQVETEWSFNAYLQELQGDNAALISLVDASGALLSVNGVRSFGIFDPYFDLEFNRDAVFGLVSYSHQRLTLDASVRYDRMQSSGTSNLASPDPDNNPGGFTPSDIDVNGDGEIVAAESGIGTVDQGDLFGIDYAVNYVSYSFGANYALFDGLAAFARYSQGASTNGDRLLLGGNGFNLSGELIDDDIGVDVVRQAELGLKVSNRGAFIPGNLNLFVTGFFANSEESNFEVTNGRAFDRTVRALGVELESSYLYGPFSLAAGLTVTDAEITEDSINPDNVGNTPRRQALLTYQVTSSWNDYLFDHGFSLGFNVVGTTGSFAQDNNDFKMPGFAQLNLFANVEILPQAILSFNANNILNVFGITEAEEGTVPENGIIRARPINGRTLSMSLRYQF